MGTQLWVVASGKGGVGKTFITSSLGITLSKLNHSVLLIDFDISGANLHTHFGVSLSDNNLRRYFNGEVKLVEITQPTHVPRLSYLQGLWDYWTPTDIQPSKMKGFIEDCKKLPYDYVIFDLGAGPHSAYLEIFVAADEKFLITNAEPTSVEKTYRYIEAYICYKLQEIGSQDSLEKLHNALRIYRSQKKHGQFSFRSYLQQATGFGAEYFESLLEHPVRLIINESRSHLDKDLGHSIKSVCNKYYDLKIDYLGHVDFDNAVWQAVGNREPVLIEKPFTPLAGQFLSFCKQLTTPNFHANLFKEVI